MDGEDHPQEEEEIHINFTVPWEVLLNLMIFKLQFKDKQLVQILVHLTHASTT